MVHGFIQYHDCRPTVLKGDEDVVGELQALVPRHGDVGQQGLGVASPCNCLPVGDQAVMFTVLHQLWRVGQVSV